MQNIPAEVESCLKAALGDDVFEKIKSGQAPASRDIGEKMSSCFSKMGPPPGQQSGPWDGQEQGNMPPQDQQRQGELFMQRVEPGQMPPEGQRSPDGQFAPGTYPNQPPPGEQFVPGTYPNQMPPGEETSGAYQYQQEQFVPGTEPMMPPPLEQTAPQSSNFDLNNALAAIITALKDFTF